MEVFYDEGVAHHIGPEPCGGLREGTDEKSVGARVGGPLRRESCSSRDAGACGRAEGNIEAHVNASGPRALRGLRPPACVHAPCAGTGRAQDWPHDVWVVRIGKSAARRR